MSSVAQRFPADEPFCYLTTIGRNSGRPHTRSGWPRHLVAGKYQPTYSGDLSGWRDTAMPVAIDLGE